MKKPEIKKNVSIKNNRASYEYSFVEKFTAGLVLKGTEIKSIRLGKANLSDSYGLLIGKEVFVRGMHISPYELAGFENHEAKADRKLLLSKREINKIEIKLKDQGLTLIPTMLFISERGFAKIEIAIAKGKKLHDKREDIKDREIRRELQRY
jgi:SsrA-binding protein